MDVPDLDRRPPKIVLHTGTTIEHGRHIRAQEQGLGHSGLQFLVSILGIIIQS